MSKIDWTVLWKFFHYQSCWIDKSISSVQAQGDVTTLVATAAISMAERHFPRRTRDSAHFGRNRRSPQSAQRLPSIPNSGTVRPKTRSYLRSTHSRRILSSDEPNSESKSNQETKKSGRVNMVPGVRRRRALGRNDTGLRGPGAYRSAGLSAPAARHIGHRYVETGD